MIGGNLNSQTRKQNYNNLIFKHRVLNSNFCLLNAYRVGIFTHEPPQKKGWNWLSKGQQEDGEENLFFQHKNREAKELWLIRIGFLFWLKRPAWICLGWGNFSGCSQPIAISFLSWQRLWKVNREASPCEPVVGVGSPPLEDTSI